MASVLTPVREPRLDTGSLKALWPSAPTPPEEQVDASGCYDLVLVCGALGVQVLGVAVEDVNVLRLGVDAGEEVVGHKAVVGLWMGLFQVYVLVLSWRGQTSFLFLIGLPSLLTMLNKTTFPKEIRPALCSATRISYTEIRLLPVGNPKTKGFSSVG